MVHRLKVMLTVEATGVTSLIMEDVESNPPEKLANNVLVILMLLKIGLVLI
jgi:hypothetical protein